MEFTDRRMLETEFRDLQRLLKTHILSGENNHTRQTEKEISEYFAGKRQRFDIELDTPGSEFQHKVWKELRNIPFGIIINYQSLAINIENSNAVRAVAAANGANRVAIVIPCHRVIGKDGAMVGYGGGLARKKWLLEHEKKHR